MAADVICIHNHSLGEHHGTGGQDLEPAEVYDRLSETPLFSNVSIKKIALLQIPHYSHAPHSLYSSKVTFIY